MAIDQRRPCSFTFDDLYHAADTGTIVDLIQNNLDDSGAIALWTQDQREKKEVEQALFDALEALRDREIRKSGVGDSVLCFVIAVVLEALQQNFSRSL